MQLQFSPQLQSGLAEICSAGTTARSRCCSGHVTVFPGQHLNCIFLFFKKIKELR